MNGTLIRAATLLMISLSAFAQAAPRLEAGLAARDITPEIGYGHYRGESTGVRDPLHAKAVVFRQGDEAAALIICDIIGAPRALVTRIRSRAAEETGIPFEHIGVAATHTHTGPDYFAELRHYVEADAAGGVPEELVEGYVAGLIEQAAGAAVDAYEAAGPVSLEVLRTEVANVSFNRRFLMKDGTVRFNPGRLNPDIVRSVGPIDPEVLTLFVWDGDGAPLGSLTNFANHLDTMGGAEYSADYPYYVEEMLRDEFGASFLSMFGLGAAGDLNHTDVASQERLTSQDIGEALGEAIRENLDGRGEFSPVLGVKSRTLFVPMQDYTEKELEWAREYASQTLYAERSFLQRRRALKLLSLHAARTGEAIPADSDGASLAFHEMHQPAIPPAASGEPWVLPVEVQAFRLGPDTAIVTLPGELFVELGLELKDRSPFQHTLVIQLANAHIAYVPTEEAFRQGDYEPVNSRLAPGGGEAMIDAAAEMLEALHDGLAGDF